MTKDHRKIYVIQKDPNCEWSLHKIAEKEFLKESPFRPEIPLYLQDENEI